ncbi:MAG: acyl-CoA dehydrogenase family protein [Acidimicrobiales bacterium]
MQLSYSESERALAEELRTWLASVLPSLPPRPDQGDWDARRRYDTDWQRMLFDAGYAGIAWPRAYGGRAASPAEQLVFMEEMNRANAPYVGVNFVGSLHAGPTIMAEGTTEQKDRYLPPILRGDEVWCQGFSEPGSGSDLASLRTRAVRDGDEYVVNGQKVWSTYAHVADVGELLVRTDPDVPKHRGLTWLIVAMDTPGITIRPIRTIAGTTEFCEVFYDDVRVPVANRVGAENDGWRVAMVTFGFERGTGFVGEIMEGVRLVRALADVAAHVTRGGATAWDDAGLRRDIGRLAADFEALWSLTKWNVSEASRDGVPGPGASVMKLRVCDAFQSLADLGMRLLGRVGLSQEDVGGLRSAHVVEEYLRGLALTIGGGTSQIQRNIVAERVLGLPKEPPWTSS